MKPNRGGTLWLDGYEGQETILIDDFRGWISFSALLHILDGYPLQQQVKGSTIKARWTHVIITSNVAWDAWYKSISDECKSALRRRLTNVVTL